MASPPRTTVKLSHERKVRSLAKKTLGSTRVGRAMRFPVVGEERGKGSVRGIGAIGIGNDGKISVRETAVSTRDGRKGEAVPGMCWVEWAGKCLPGGTWSRG